MKAKLKQHPLHDSHHAGGAIRFIDSSGKTHIFSSWVNRLSGDRLSGFDNGSPSVGDSLQWVTSVFRDIRAKAKVLDEIGTLKPKP